MDTNLIKHKLTKLGKDMKMSSDTQYLVGKDFVIEFQFWALSYEDPFISVYKKPKTVNEKSKEYYEIRNHACKKERTILTTENYNEWLK